MSGRVGATWESKVPHGNGKRPDLLVPGLRNHFVYRFYNAAGEIIYVGCTRRPEQRWKEHQKDSRSMVAEAVACRMSGPYDYPSARRIERQQQYDYRPKYNPTPITRDRGEAPWAAYSPETYLDPEGWSA